MTLTTQIAKHFGDVHTGGNWTVSNLKDTLADVTWQEATMQVYELNTIATLLFHVNYFVGVTMKVLLGGPLEGNDKLSFAHPPLHSEEDWRRMVDKAIHEAGEFADLIGQMPETKLWENLPGDKYGNYYRNLHGIIEHTHYHLGQMAVIKKIIRQKASGN